LSGTAGKLLKVSKEELSKHNTLEDCWIAVHGKVYNVTPYLDFHPGGVDEMMRGAGKDATNIFNEVHQYVNFASMLKKCHVGDYVPKGSPLMDVQSQKQD
jgi:cytochrome-b5 reductase